MAALICGSICMLASIADSITLDDYSSIGILVYSGKNVQDTPYTVEDKVLWFNVKKEDIFAVYYIEELTWYRIYFTN